MQTLERVLQTAYHVCTPRGIAVPVLDGNAANEDRAGIEIGGVGEFTVPLSGAAAMVRIFETEPGS